MRAALLVLLFAGTAFADERSPVLRGDDIDTTIFDLDPTKRLELGPGPLVRPPARPARLWVSAEDTRPASQRAREAPLLVEAPVFAPSIWCGNARAGR